MKKTLVAMAVLAATSASFAQVTITGKVGFSVQKNSSVNNATQGLRTTDGDVTFRAEEDLGGGFKGIASTAIKLRGRDTTVTTRDAFVSLVTPAGVFSGGSTEMQNLLVAGYAGAPMSFDDGPSDQVQPSPTLTNKPLILDPNYYADGIQYVVPVGSSFKLELGYFEVNVGDDATSTAGNSTTVSAYAAKGTYASGALMVTGDYTAYSAGDPGSSTTPAVQQSRELNSGLTRLRLAGTYDFGVVKLGLGYQNKSRGVASQYSMGLSVPYGAFTFGVTYSGRNKQEAVVGNYGTLVSAADARNGTTLGVQYDFSKYTNIYLGYATYSGVSATPGGAITNDNEYRLRLLKKF